MSLICIFGSTYLNPACVGKVTFDCTFEGVDTRVNTTTVFDTTGQFELAKLTTEVARFNDSTGPERIRRDNHFHSEIVKALTEVKDAHPFVES